MKGFVCKVCGFISIDGSAPEKCPVCGSPKTAFEEKEGAIKTPKDPNNLTELEKKHIPVITIVKKCGLIPEGCQDLHVKMGEIQHPMLPEHYIMHIDFYIDDNLKATVSDAPYSFLWDDKSFKRHTIKIVAYDVSGNFASDEINVFKFF